jgi:hypothetical protein
MSKTVSFTCSEELNEFLEEEAERRMTTKSLVCQQIVANYATDVSQDPANENTPVNAPEPDHEPIKTESIGEEKSIRFGEFETAQRVRNDLPQWISENDDERKRSVTFRPETPVGAFNHVLRDMVETAE